MATLQGNVHVKYETLPLMVQKLWIRLKFLWQTHKGMRLEVLLEWIQFYYDMVTLFVQNNIQKARTQNTQWNQRYRWKRYRSVIRRNARHFPPASGRMTPTSVCLWRFMYSPHCGWLNFCGVPIFIVFVEGSIHEFQYLRIISDFLYKLWRKKLLPRILNSTNVSFSFNPWKLEPTKKNPSTVSLTKSTFAALWFVSFQLNKIYV